MREKGIPIYGEDKEMSCVKDNLPCNVNSSYCRREKREFQMLNYRCYWHSESSYQRKKKGVEAK